MLIIKISKKGKITNIEKPDISFIEKNKNISKLNKWNYNNYEFVLYGCEDGVAGEENKYDLPPPVDCELYFNDLYFIKLNQNKLEDLSIQDYNIFYNDCFKGFEDIQLTDDEEEPSLSEHTSDKEFINDEDISLISATNDIDLSELSEFTSDEDYTDNEKTLNNEDEISDLSSIEITISSCDEEEDEEDEEEDIEDFNNIENDLEVDTD